MPLPKVWVYAEGEDGKATSATLELLTKAREIGDTVEAVYSGADADAIAPQLGEYGATKVHSTDHGSSLSGVIGGALLAKIVADEQPDLILFAQSYDGRDAMGRLSVKLDRPVLTNGTLTPFQRFAAMNTRQTMPMKTGTITRCVSSKSRVVCLSILWTRYR